jgi:2'-5' RNA ligase
VTELKVATATLQTNRLDRKTLDGREYAVAPVVALIAGVRNGELVMVEELSAFAAAWDGRPIPVRHPQDGEGNYITANSPTVIEQQVIGQFFDARVEGDALVGELWIDVAKARLLGGDALMALNRMERGEILEVSTGYFCDIDDSTGEWLGQPYSGIQRNLRPDHVALLPDEVGACSVAEGCGANRLNRVNAADSQTGDPLDFSQSIMVAFYLAAQDAEALALAEGALADGRVLPAAELHVTLAYLGEIADMQAEYTRVAQLLSDFAGERVVVLASVAGVGRFANAETGMDALFLLLDSEGLHQFRFWLADLLEWDLGLDVPRRWGYVPHVTLGYVPNGTEAQLAPVPVRQLVFDKLALSWGQQTVVFPLRGEAVTPMANAVSVNCSCSTTEEIVDEQDKQAKACKAAPKANEDVQAATVAPVEGTQEQAAIAPAAPAVPDELAELAAAIREFGGVGALMEAVRGIKANTDRDRAARVARLAANSRCAFGKEDLDAMTPEQLVKLENSLTPRVFVGQNGGMGLADFGGPDGELRVFKGFVPAEQAKN